MTRRNLSEEWRLEDGENSQEQWKLEPAEQNAISQWQLEGSEGNGADWQPVEYERQQRNGGNWVLPALVGVALVAVVAYIAWIGLQRMGLFETTTPAAEPTSAVAVAPTTEAAPTLEAAASTPAPPTPTPSPEPTATATFAPTPTATQIPLVQVQTVFVNTAGGVNARREPDLNAEIIRIVAQNEELLVNADQTDWIQIALPERQLGWVAAEFVERRSSTVTLDEANRRREAVGLPALVVTPPEAAPSALITPTLAAPEVAPVPAPIGISVTVTITGGLNARETPSLDGTIVRQLETNSSYTALARSADSQWLLVQLPEGRTAWVFAALVAANGDINTLSTDLPAPAVSAANPVTATAPISPTAAVTNGVTQVVSGITASVTNLAGVNARPTPDANAEPLQLLPFDSVVPVVGRSADGAWVQVTLEEGRLAWVLAEAVTISTDPATLPVVNP